MAKFLEFYKKDENDSYVTYDIESDGFHGEVIIDKNDKIFELEIHSTSKYLNDEEMKESEYDRLNFVLNKRTDNLTVFPDILSYYS